MEIKYNEPKVVIALYDLSLWFMQLSRVRGSVTASPAVVIAALNVLIPL